MEICVYIFQNKFGAVGVKSYHNAADEQGSDEQEPGHQ